MEKFKIELDRVIRASAVIFHVDDQGCMNGDLSACQPPDLKHIHELLEHIIAVEVADPGFMEEILSFLPHLIKLKKAEVLGVFLQKECDERGFGGEWRDTVAAGKHPKQKDYMANMVAFHMKANGLNQSQSIQELARQSGKDKESFLRTVTRSKKRSKT
jgi:hypothetical protein